jgi:YgiT-type zinc finger domain-containing protein
MTVYDLPAVYLLSLGYALDIGAQPPDLLNYCGGAKPPPHIRRHSREKQYASMSNNKSTYDYGKCHVCGEQMKEKKINQDFWLKGKLIVIESVPAGVCPQCGEKIVKAEVGRQLATLIQNLKRLPKRKTITVPVVRYAKKVA